jgi:hypothetical protein
MKVTVIHKDSDVHVKDHSFYNDFIKFLHKEYPLKKDIKILFLKERIGKMTTGSRNSKNEIRILTKKRLNRDILRTLVHEWVHEYQRTTLGRGKGKDIGGKNENEANAISGALIKKFEKRHPDKEELMYH